MTERELLPETDLVGGSERPRVIFSTELAGKPLHALLAQSAVLAILAEQGYSVALTLVQLDDDYAAVAHLLNQRDIPVIACLSLPPEEGFAFNLQNYPRALACYQTFRDWARQNRLRFEAVGLSIEPPLADVTQQKQRGPRALARRFWLARENVLYPSALAFYNELIVTIHLDGYDVHTFQMPVIADDRRAGTTLIQRALDIVDLPSDLDVLMCASSVPIDLLSNDLGGALIASYGANADAIGVGSIDDGDPDIEGRAPLPWLALRRDLLLAAPHTDTIYVFDLEDCVERGLLPKIAALDWAAPAHARPSRRVLIGVLRGLLFVLLVAGQFWRTMLAWGGWALVIVLLLRSRRARKDDDEERRWG